jgi:hypothetical protein
MATYVFSHVIIGLATFSTPAPGSRMKAAPSKIFYKSLDL